MDNYNRIRLEYLNQLLFPLLQTSLSFQKGNNQETPLSLISVYFTAVALLLSMKIDISIFYKLVISYM